MDKVRIPKILSIGEVLWDQFPDGPRLGGAPANFACACASLGQPLVSVAFATAVGDDELGRQALDRLSKQGVQTHLVQTYPEPTGQVFVELDAQGHGHYRFLTDCAWDRFDLSPDWLEAAQSADLVYFGTLGQRSEQSRRTIQAMLQAVSPRCIRVLDLNLRPPFWTPDVLIQSLSLTQILKLNDEELPILAEVLGLSGSTIQNLQRIQNRFSLQMIALTRGANGSMWLLANGQRRELDGIPVSVVDTVGAGDTFTAVLALGLAHHLDLPRIHEWANQVAAYVCTQPGATPSFWDEQRLAAIL